MTNQSLKGEQVGIAGCHGLSIITDDEGAA